MENSCGGCDSRWTGHSRSHRSGCHMTFSGVTAFDRHRRGSRCVDPSAIGLVENHPGLWGFPASDGAPWGDAA